MDAAPTIILGVGASVSAFKAVEVLRFLTKAGLDVHVAPTADSVNFVGLSTWQSLSGHDAVVEPFALDTQIGHVELADKAQALVIVAATADLLAKLRLGLAQDMLTLLAVAASCKVFVAPAMHPSMWDNPATQENVAVLRKRGWAFIGPESGLLADGQTGMGRLASPQKICDTVVSSLKTTAITLDPVFWSGKNVLISAGGTQEPWDEVRFLGNRSSGRQGTALARSAQVAGANVDLVVANVESALYPSGVTIHQAPSAQDLLETMTRLAPNAQIVIQCAAVADFRPSRTQNGKITRHEGELPILELEATPDVLAALVANRQPGQLIVGFAAQTGSEQEVLAAGKAKARRKGADLLAVNQVGSNLGFGDVPNRLRILDKTGQLVREVAGTKDNTAEGLLAQIADEYGKLNGYIQEEQR